ncbi:MAG: hypothetical protein H8E44_06395 [Planctomycetes bacterium]|nr:hypothetical protein [Planctomycetota bacterium]MBL7039360.1 hypothetical protein [Pirellulaceae bacterium]
MSTHVTSKSVGPRRRLVGCLSLLAAALLVTIGASTARAQLGMPLTFQSQMRTQSYNRSLQGRNNASYAAISRSRRFLTQRSSAINSGRSPRYSVWQPQWRARRGWGRRYR